MNPEQADELQQALDNCIVGDQLHMAALIEPLIPKVKMLGLDLFGMIGASSSVLGIKTGAPLIIAVVDGHEEVDVEAEDFDWEDYEQKFCIKIPGEIAQAALTLRMQRDMFELASKK